MSRLFTKFLVILSLFALLAGVLIRGHSKTVRAETVQTVTQNGPALGETIDLTSWRDRNGRTLAEVNNKKHSLALVAFVTPNCDSCMKSKDAMQALRERAGKANIAYYVLMIPADGTNAQQYFSYADSLKIDADSFVWSNTNVKPPASLITMPAPSHLLLADEGLVVNKWNGVPPNVDSQ